MTLKFPFYSFFFMNLIMSTLFSISSYSWLAVWTGLEFNLISFLPLLMTNPSPSSSEAAMKYFIVQAFSSAILLLMLLLSNIFPYMMMTNLILILSLSIKMGLAPFHHWVPNVTASLTWSNLLILLTWQKIAPTALICQFMSSFNSKFLFLSSALSALIGGLGGLNQTQMRTILAFSSIGHMGWTVSALMTSTCDSNLYF